MRLRVLLACAFSGLVLFGQATSALLRTWADAEKLELQSDAQPDDVSVRLQLMRYYFQQGFQSADRVKPLRRKHIVWMIEHRPDHVILSEPSGTVDRSGNPMADADGFAAADAAWRKQLAGGPPLADTFANAAAFYKIADPSYARTLVEDGLKLYPGNNRIASVKGSLLAYSILGVKQLDQYGRASSFDEALAKSDDAARARKELQASTDPNLLGSAAGALLQQSYPLSSRNLTARLKEVEDLTAHLYQRAIELDPNNMRWKSGMMSAYQSLAMQKRAPAEKIELLEKAAGIAPGAVQRSYVLTELSQSYFNTGNSAKASETANELVNTAENKSDWNYGNAIHIGNIVLGRIALSQGNVPEAGRYLLAAGRTPGSPQLNSFGPNWNLAQDLIGRGDRASVLAYLDLCRNFWKLDKGRLDSYAATIRSGGIPNFFGSPEISRSQLMGKAAPDFRLKDLKGAEVALSEFKGKIVLIDFWATWCPPCRQEMPDFQTIHRDLSGQDVVVLAVDADEPRDTVAEFINKEKYTFPVLLAAGGDVVTKYSVHAYPTVFAVDKSGRIAEILEGGGTDNASRLNAAIAKARAGAPPAAPENSPEVSREVSHVMSSEPAIALPPATTAADFYREGVRLRVGRDLTGAIKAFDRALELRQEWTMAMLARANCYYQLKQYDAAIAGLNQALKLDPKRASAYAERGLCYSYSGRHAQAIPDYTRAIDITPDSSTAYNNRGWAYLELGQPGDSLRDLNQSIELNPANQSALKNRARLYTMSKDYGKAVADYEAVMRVNPGDSQAAANRDTVLRLMKGGAASAAPGSLHAPRLLSPSDGAVFEHFPRHTTLVWGEVAGAAGYMVEWDYKSSGVWASDSRGNASTAFRTTEPVFAFQFVGAQPGRWRAWAVDANGNAGSKSDWREFRYTK